MKNSSLVIGLMGPTATGKTDIAVELVQRFPCEIISVDSAMVYRGLDIGTAKPSKSILSLAPHRLIDIKDPSEPYSAGQFCEDALQEMIAIQSQGKIPLLVGGTLLYFWRLKTGMALLPDANSELRAQLSMEAEQIGWPAMHEKLRRVDPLAAKRIHPNDSQRIQRALEVYSLTGKTISQLQHHETVADHSFHFMNIAIAPSNRAVLHERIAKRFDAMLAAGFVDEVQALRARADIHADLPAMRMVGYRQVWQYLEGELTYEQMRERGIIATRQLAKRQFTWLNQWHDLIRIDSYDKSSLLASIETALRNIYYTFL